MIDKGSVVINALSRLGDISAYNDDRSRTYQSAEKILPMVLKKICSDTSLNFNVSKTKLTKYNEQKEENGEYKFNLPENFLGIAKVPKAKRSVSSKIIPVSYETSYAHRENFRLQGEFIYTDKEEITLYYSKSIPLTEFPDYMFDYIVWRMTVEMALMYPQFTERLPYCEARSKEALYDIQRSEGLGVVFYG